MKKDFKRRSMEIFEWSEGMTRVLLVFSTRALLGKNYVSKYDLERYGVNINSWYTFYEPALLDQAGREEERRPLIKEVTFEKGHPMRKNNHKYYKLNWDFILGNVVKDFLIEDVEKVKREFLDYRDKLKKKSKDLEKPLKKEIRKLLVRIKNYKASKNPIIQKQLNYEIISLKSKELSLKSINEGFKIDSTIKLIKSFFASKDNRIWLNNKLSQYFLSLLNMNVKRKSFYGLIRDFFMGHTIYCDEKNVTAKKFHKVATEYSKYYCLNPEAISAFYWGKKRKEHQEIMEKQEKEYVEYLIKTGQEDMLTAPEAYRKPKKNRRLKNES